MILLYFDGGVPGGFAFEYLGFLVLGCILIMGSGGCKLDWDKICMKDVEH